MDISRLYSLFLECGKVTTDSRTLKGGEMFFALKGENFDGNEYALKALDAGAACAVVSETSAAAGADGYGSRVIPVKDTLETLQALARYHRSMTFVNGRPLPVIGLTGTNGKTTTKELIKAVLSVRYNVTATEGNLNNSIGVPLTLLRIDANTQIAVVEMGASHPGDIKELVSVALPDYGLITNVGKAHLLGFGSFDGVMKAKGELYDYLQRTADVAFLNADNPYLCRMASERPDLRTVPYGVDCQGAEILETSASDPYLRMRVPDNDGVMVGIDTRLIGAYNADNVMAALAVGKAFGISLREAAAAVSAYVPSNSRSQMMKTSGNILIVDAYNANPTSMDAALTNFAGMESPHKVMMLGDMLELGTDSVKEHLEIVRKAARSGLETYFVGEEFKNALDLYRRETGDACFHDNRPPVHFMQFDNSDMLASWIKANPLEGYTVLIKGSHGIGLQSIIDLF